TREIGYASDVRLIEGAGFVGLDGASAASEEELLGYMRRFLQERTQASEFDPDVWAPIVIRDPLETQGRMTAAAGDKYSYREMDDFTDEIEKTIKTVPVASKVSRSGILNEKVYLEYSQERVASYGFRGANLRDILSARNITVPGGQLQVEGKNLNIDPSGEFKSEEEIGDVVVATSNGGAPVYLRDLVTTVRSYDSPARYLNFYTWRCNQGGWHRTRAITLSIQMRAGEKIGEFGKAVDAVLADLKKRLPDDLVMARTSDQPLQVEENVHLFMNSLYE